jgi:hypothetical protein
MNDGVREEIKRFVDCQETVQLVGEEVLVKNYVISEEADMFGFSLMKSYCEFPFGRVANVNNLELLKNDVNWHNPGSISLMMSSFGIPNTLTDLMTLSDYMSIKKEQQPIFAERHLKTGNRHLVTKQYKEALRFFADALNYDPNSVDAMVGRASALLHLGHLLEANKQMNCIASDIVVGADALTLRKRISDRMYAAGLGAQVRAVSSSSVGVSGITFVDKLRLSLQSDQKGTQSNNNDLVLRDADEVDSDDTSESSQEQNSNKNKKRKKDKKSDRRKSKKSRRSEQDSDSDRSRRRKRSKSDKKSKKKHKLDDE